MTYTLAQQHFTGCLTKKNQFTPTELQSQRPADASCMLISETTLTEIVLHHRSQIKTVHDEERDRRYNFFGNILLHKYASGTWKMF